MLAGGRPPYIIRPGRAALDMPPPDESNGPGPPARNVPARTLPSRCRPRSVSMPAPLARVAPDIGPILSLVRKTRLLLRSSWGVTGAGLTLGLASAALAATTAADLLVPLVGPWLRLAGLVLFVVPTLVVFVWKGVLPLGRRLRNIEVARRIEAHIPGMHSRLVSCMDLAGRHQDVSP